MQNNVDEWEGGRVSRKSSVSVRVPEKAAGMSSGCQMSESDFTA